MESGWFALGGVLLGLFGNFLLERYKTGNLLKVEDAKSALKARTEGLPLVINFCDRIMMGYDPTERPDYAWFHSFCGQAEALRAHYSGFPPEIIDVLERVYVFLSAARDIGHPDFDTADVEDFFENSFVDEIATLRKLALDTITSARPYLRSKAE